MTVPAWQPQVCHAVRDCDCCGARGSLICLERDDHASVHAFLCRHCGKDPRC